jgi:hypothetical protein
MEFFKFIELENGNITLEKIVIDYNKYNIINEKNGNITLEKKIAINIIDIKELKNYDFKKSIILNCLINDELFNKFKYNQILKQIYNIINDGVKIIKKTKLNIKTIKKLDEGYYYLDNIGISIQGADSNKYILEIFNQYIENNIKLSLEIMLINNIKINISI